MFRVNILLVFEIIFVCALLSGPAYAKKTYAIKGFIGESASQAAPNKTIELLDGNTGDVIDGMSTNFFGKYKFSGLAPGVYIIKVDSLQKKVYVKEKDVRLDIDLSVASGTMDYAGNILKEMKKDTKPKTTVSDAPSNKGNNTSLAAQIAGTWWGYSGSTERKIGLCADGSYKDYAESSYSGTSHDSGGNETMSWGSAGQNSGNGTWIIQGDGQKGIIYVTYSNGNNMMLKYQQCGEVGCLLFNGNKLCRSSGSCK